MLSMNPAKIPGTMICIVLNSVHTTIVLTIIIPVNMSKWENITVSVLKGGSVPRMEDYKHVRMTDFDIPKDCSDFFDYLRKSYSYDYASTEDIARIDIYMIDTDSY